MKAWRFAASTGCCIEQPIFSTIDAMHEGGVRAVELSTPPRHFDPWRHEDVAALRERLQRLGIEPVSIHAPFGGLLDLSDPNPHHRHAAIGAILTAASALREVGGSRIVVHTTDVPRHGQHVGDRLACCADALRVLARSCAQMGVTLLVETPLPHLIGGHPDEFAFIIRKLDAQVGVCLDTSHTTLGGHWERFIQVAGARLAHVHANDHRGDRDDHLTPGDGIIDWRWIRDTLVRARFDGWIVLELACPAQPIGTYFARALARAGALLA